MELKDRVAIVTGGGTNAGRAIALEFARQGARVVVASRTQADLDETVRMVKEQGGQALAVKTDVGVEDQVKNLVKQTATNFGKVDIMVNNAAYTGDPGRFTEVQLDEWHRIFASTIVGTMLCTRECFKYMVQRKRGVILNISTQAAKQGYAPMAAYAAAKAGIENLTRTLALEVGQYGIRVNSITLGNPGWQWRSPKHIALIGGRAKLQGITLEQAKAGNLARSPLGIFPEEDDIANLSVFLVSDKARAMTGQCVNLSAGREMR